MYIVITKRKIMIAIAVIVILVIMFALAWLGECLRPECCAIDIGYYQRGVLTDQSIGCLFFNKADFNSRMITRIGLILFSFLIIGFAYGLGGDEKRE